SNDTNWYNLRGHGGNLSFSHTVVTSWDTSLSPPGPRTLDPDDYESRVKGRSYISCVSERAPEQECVGQSQNEMGECRMDIINSEMGYLGYYQSESYGLTWKVRGFCTVTKENLNIFDKVNVYGDVMNSDIHHLFYGLYTYGHQGGFWTNNKMRDNWWYGFDPHDDSDYLTIHNNEVYNNGKHGIIASKRCNHVSIQNNHVYNGGETAAGIFLHRSSDNAIVRGNYIHNMQDACFAVLESFNLDIQNNYGEFCKYGIRFSVGSADNVFKDNTLDYMASYTLYTYFGSDGPDVADNDGRPKNNLFEGNIILNSPTGMKIKEGDSNVFKDNIFMDTSLFTLDDSIMTEVTGNTYPDDAVIE
ncbi:unnamed protein product, partial [Discosporangium mesarthrocarpum]